MMPCSQFRPQIQWDGSQILFQTPRSVLWRSADPAQAHGPGLRHAVIREAPLQPPWERRALVPRYQCRGVRRGRDRRDGREGRIPLVGKLPARSP